MSCTFITLIQFQTFTLLTPFSLPDASTRDVNAVVGACQSYLMSQKPTRSYGALRLLSRVASVNAAAVATCNLDLESLLTDSNRAIATLAITTLLKTGAENSVERFTAARLLHCFL